MGDKTHAVHEAYSQEARLFMALWELKQLIEPTSKLHRRKQSLNMK